MDRSVIVTLLDEVIYRDDIGQELPNYSEREVFASVGSVSLNEWATAGNLGMKPELKITMFAPDYEGEKIVVVDGKRYNVYRTFVAKNENIELYVQRDVNDVTDY